MRTFLSLVATALVASSTVVGAAARAEAAPVSCTAVTPAALASYFDGAVPSQLGPNNVPGVVVSVVNHDTARFSKGYGLADVGRGIPMNADTSLVRLASVSKLLTFTAVMQQVQAGKLDLNADVNQYLTDFKVPATFPEPITLSNLMNHTAGFEDRIIGTGALNAAEVPPLGKYLADAMPARIRPPGEVTAYSNYGAALTGYIVSQVAGQPYDAYIQQHVLDPLRMDHSTATEPVPSSLAGDLAASYNSDYMPARRVPFEFDKMAPDGSMSASATDMGHFMMANLNEGRYGDAEILSPATMAQMHTRSFDNDPRLSGYAHGFQDKTMNGRRVLMHDGGWEGFLSALILIPGCDLGLFMAANATGGDAAMPSVIDGFFDRFAPAPATPDPNPSVPSSLVPSAPVAGFYGLTRHNESTVEKLLTLLGPLRLTIGADGTVHFKGKDWRQLPDGRYANADGTDHLVFLTGPDGQRYVGTDLPAYQLLGPASSLTNNLLLLAGFAVIALSGLAVLVTALVRRLRRRSAPTTRAWRAGRLLAAGGAVVGLVFLVGLFVQLLGDAGDFLYGAPPRFRLLLVLPVVALGLAGGALGTTIGGWRGSGAGIVARTHQVVLLIGLVALGWFLWQWNLIGWRF